jgi:hypothetical protein
LKKPRTIAAKKIKIAAITKGQIHLYVINKYPCKDNYVVV